MSHDWTGRTKSGSMSADNSPDNKTIATRTAFDDSGCKPNPLMSQSKNIALALSCNPVHWSFPASIPRGDLRPPNSTLLRALPTEPSGTMSTSQSVS